MYKKIRICKTVAVLSIVMSPTLSAQAPSEKIDIAVIDQIKDEGASSIACHGVDKLFNGCPWPSFDRLANYEVCGRVD